MRCLLTLVLAALLSDAALADAPLEPPGTPRRECSLNGRWCVNVVTGQSDAGKVTAVRVEAQGAASKGSASKGEGWTTSVHLIGLPAVTNDGGCLIDLATGSNLLSLDKGPHDPAFVVHCNGQQPAVLSLGKFIADFDALPRSTSHRIWARKFGLDARDRLVLQTAEGRDFLIEPRSGKLLQGAYLR